MGIFGGTFDPPHNAHIKLARFAIRRLQLDCVYFVPAAIHALKKHRITPVALRYEMLLAAIGQAARLRLSRIEMDRPDISYSVDTIKNFKKYEHLRARTELYFLVGLDNLNELHLWKDPQLIFKLARVVVFNRPTLRDQQLLGQYPQIMFLEGPLYDISATAIRSKIKSGKPVTELIPARVWKIIRENNLYRD